MLCRTVATGLLLVILIVNNGNMWSDGRRYKKRPKIEMQICGKKIQKIYFI